MRNLLVLFVLLISPGCFGNSVKLDIQWSPLTSITEDSLKIIPTHTITTIGNNCYIRNLKDFYLDYPLGSVKYNAVLTHEREHAVREHAYSLGVDAWLTKYMLDRNFRWDEEKAGWKLEILYLQSHGEFVDAKAMAADLNSNYRFGGRMVSYDEAYKWILDVLAGKQ